MQGTAHLEAPLSNTMLISHEGRGKPDIVVDELTRDDGIRYKGTFDSMSRETRVTLFQALITPDQFKYPLMLEIQRDRENLSRVFIVVQNPKVQFDMKEFYISFR